MDIHVNLKEDSQALIWSTVTSRIISTNLPWFKNLPSYSPLFRKKYHWGPRPTTRRCLQSSGTTQDHSMCLGFLLEPHEFRVQMTSPIEIRGHFIGFVFFHVFPWDETTQKHTWFLCRLWMFLVHDLHALWPPGSWVKSFNRICRGKPWNHLTVFAGNHFLKMCHLEPFEFYILIQGAPLQPKYFGFFFGTLSQLSLKVRWRMGQSNSNKHNTPALYTLKIQDGNFSHHLMSKKGRSPL